MVCVIIRVFDRLQSLLKDSIIYQTIWQLRRTHKHCRISRFYELNHHESFPNPPLCHCWNFLPFRFHWSQEEGWRNGPSNARYASRYGRFERGRQQPCHVGSIDARSCCEWFLCRLVMLRTTESVAQCCSFSILVSSTTNPLSSIGILFLF